MRRRHNSKPFSQEQIDTVESIFWNDKKDGQWDEATLLLKSLSGDAPKQLLNAAMQAAEEQQTFYGVKENESSKVIKDNSRRLRDVKKLMLTWIATP